MSELANGRAWRAVFLDRDGVLNRVDVRQRKPCAPRRIEEFVILPGVAEACAILKQRRFLLVVVSRFSDPVGVEPSRSTVAAMHDLLVKQLPIDRIENCRDDLPLRGLVLQVAQEWDVDLHASFRVCARGSEVECGRADWWPAQQLHRTQSLLDAARWIVSREERALPSSPIQLDDIRLDSLTRNLQPSIERPRYVSG